MTSMGQDGGEKIWESQSGKLLGMIVDTKFSFDLHLQTLCKKVD